MGIKDRTINTGIDKLITEQTGMPVNVADNPLDCVVDGTGIYLESDVLGKVGKRA